MLEKSIEQPSQVLSNIECWVDAVNITFEWLCHAWYLHHPLTLNASFCSSSLTLQRDSRQVCARRDHRNGLLLQWLYCRQGKHTVVVVIVRAGWYCCYKVWNLNLEEHIPKRVFWSTHCFYNPATTICVCINSNVNIKYLTLAVQDLEEAEYVAKYIVEGGDKVNLLLLHSYSCVFAGVF